MSVRKVMRIEEAAVYIGIAIRTLRTWCQRGRGPAFIKLGDHPNSPLGFCQEDLDEWLLRRTKLPAYPGSLTTKDEFQHNLTDAQWDLIHHLMPAESDCDYRAFIDCCFRVIWHGTDWARLPARYGDPKVIRARFWAWSGARRWDRILRVLCEADPAFAFRIAEQTSIIAVRRTGNGAYGPEHVQGQMTLRTRIPYGRKFRRIANQWSRQYNRSSL